MPNPNVVFIVRFNEPPPSQREKGSADLTDHSKMKKAILNFQYQYSRLFNDGLNRKKFEVIRTKDKLYALNTSKNTFISLLFTLLASGHIFSGLILGATSTDQLSADFYLIFLLLFVVGLVAFRQFLWLINGQQEIIIENGILTLTKKGTFFTKSKKYSFDKIENIRMAFDEENLTLFDRIQRNISVNQNIIFNHIYGQILFDYNRKTIKVFCDLEKKERLKLIEEMNKMK